VFDKRRGYLLSKEALAEAEGYIKQLLDERAREAKAAKQPAAVAKRAAEIKRHITDIHALGQPEAAAPLVAALERQLEELHTPATARTDRQLLAANELPRVLAKYVQQMEQGFRALSGPEAVAKARAAMTSLLVGGTITLGPDADNANWVGTMRLKHLGDFALELSGRRRKLGFSSEFHEPPNSFNVSKKATSRPPPR
jgi:hypothetical protein